MPGNPRPALVVSIAYDNWSLFEAGIVSEVFGLPRPEFPRPLYRFRVARAETGLLRSRGGLRIQVDGGLRLLRSAQLIIVPGWRNHLETPPRELLDAIASAHRRGSQLMSICTGAFVLAAAGVLDGRCATTHWRYAQVFRDRFPNVTLRPDVLYVDEGDVITSAGSAAGIDACLHVVRRDHGSRIANVIARTMVTPPHRDGTQAQFVPQPLPLQVSHSVAPAMEWARRHLSDSLRVADMAARAAMSQRTFLRHFMQQVGLGPKDWLRRERVASAQLLLETSRIGLDAVAQRAGFGSVETMRTAFRDIVGAPPSRHRALFGGLVDARG